MQQEFFTFVYTLYQSSLCIMFGVTILGNNAALPVYGRHPTAQVVTLKDQLLLIDCGEGTQMQLSRYKIRISKINYIFISHLHGDHYFGLIGLLTSYGLLNRKSELTIICPPELPAIIQIQLDAANIHLSYPIQFKLMGEAGTVVETKHFRIDCFAVSHRIKCWGCWVEEKKLPRKINREQVLAHQIPAAYYGQLQLGADYQNSSGEIIKNEQLTFPASLPRSYAFSADTLYMPELASILKGVSLLYHETTYLQDQPERAKERYHSTTVQAAAIASAAAAKQLIIGHFSSKYEDIAVFETESKLVFPNTSLAVEGVTYLIQ